MLRYFPWWPPPSPLPQGNSPRKDFLFDEEKNSWQLPRGKEYEDFLFDEGKNLIETLIQYRFEIFSLLTLPPSPLPGGLFLHEDFLFDEEKTHCSQPSPPRSNEDFSLLRNSSLKKRKTHGCPRMLPRVFLFVKEEILTGLISLWVGEREGIWGFPLWQSKKPNWNLKRISPPPSHKDFFLVRIFS